MKSIAKHYDEWTTHEAGAGRTAVRRAFYAGAAAMFLSTLEVGTARVEEGEEFLAAVNAELTAFFERDHARRSPAGAALVPKPPRPRIVARSHS